MRLGTNQITEYGDYRFNSSVDTVGFSVRPYKTGDGRSTKWNEWNITLVHDIQSDSDTSPMVKNAISKLTHQGQTFKYTRRGTGNPGVNTDVMDVAWGPETDITNIEIVGSEQVVRITWNIKFRVPACLGLWNNNPFILEFVQNRSDSLDRGYDRLACSGYLVIANNRESPESRTIRAHVDDFRDTIPPVYPDNYRFEWGQWRVSPDASRVDFSWTLAELPEPLPPGCSMARVSDSVNSTAAGLAKWQGQISGHYELVKGYTGGQALAYFMTDALNMISERARAIGEVARDDKGRSKYGAFVPLSFRMANPDRYGPPSGDFELSYSFAVPIQFLFDGINLWPESPYKHSDWQLSMKGAHAVKGQLRIEELEFHDPCYGQWTEEEYEEETHKAKKKSKGWRSIPKPSPDSSWMHFECELLYENDSCPRTIKLQPGQVFDGSTEMGGANGLNGMGDPTVPDVLDTAGSSSPIVDVIRAVVAVAGEVEGGEAQNTGEEVEGGEAVLPTEPQTPTPGATAPTTANSIGIVVSRSQPTTVVYVVGAAIRAGYEIPPPILRSVDGLPAIPANRTDRGEGFLPSAQQQLNCVIYSAVWRLRYILPGVPRNLIVAQNPTLGG